MRNIFVKKFIEEAEKNKEIYFLTGDLGYNSFEIIKEKFPDRFINVGCAENNMIGIASGLALSGKKVFVYSIVPFLVFRSFEQIRNYICHNNLPYILFLKFFDDGRYASRMKNNIHKFFIIVFFIVKI